jgi:hypothetical protein
LGRDVSILTKYLDWFLEAAALFAYSGFASISLMAQVVNRTEVLSAYRYLLRSIAIAFQGDHVRLSAARKEARKRFEMGKILDPDSAEALDGVTEARNVGKFLRHNLVQGIKDENSDVYRTYLYKLGLKIGLRIHDETERGDNLSIKNPLPIPVPERKTRRRKTELS